MTRPQHPSPDPGQLTFQIVEFSFLKGWSADDHAAALEPFLKSCGKFATWPKSRALGGIGGKVSDWTKVCTAAYVLRPAMAASARQFFEQNFKAVAVSFDGRIDGLFTGYYEPELRGSRAKKVPYVHPLYGVPGDLIAADLGEFNDDLKGRRIFGRVEGNRMRPYPNRSQIEAGALYSRGLEIVYVDDLVDAFFLQIQGSGRVRLTDGGMMRLGYAGSNGQRYYAIGRELIKRGILDKADISMQSIRAWLMAHPVKGRAVMNLNPSYVFFRELKGPGPIGALGVPLTPGRSIAVDRQLIPLGVPIWLQARRPDADVANPDRLLRRLVLGQDTGGAIKGGVRGDVFWGHGKDAAAIAGRMKHRGRWFILLPNALADRL